jgi:hypothetical protein
MYTHQIQEEIGHEVRDMMKRGVATGSPGGEGSPTHSTKSFRYDTLYLGIFTVSHKSGKVSMTHQLKGTSSYSLVKIDTEKLHSKFKRFLTKTML